MLILFQKVPVQLDHTVWIYDRIYWTDGWIHIHCDQSCAIFEPNIWFILAFYCYCWRNGQRIGYIQCHYRNVKTKSFGIDETLLSHYTDLYGCTTVRNWLSFLHFNMQFNIYCNFSRCVKEFQGIHQFSLLASFLLNVLCASSILVTLQFQLVKYLS